MGVSIYELICRACGNTMKRTMTQFDSLPSCSKCDSEMLVENVTTEKENDNGNTKKV